MFCSCSIAISGLLMGTLSPAAVALPSVKLLTAPLIAPVDAWAYYGTSTTHTNGVAYSATRPPEIKEIARALGAERISATPGLGQITADTYAASVYEYVRNNIEVDFRFGLSKGARGAIIDQSGTPFDQAHLMVELLREAGVTAGYRVGTINLNATQFSDWTGLTNAKAACKFLADGAFPATVNGVSDCDSAALAGNVNVSAVVMGHIWVAANAKLYDAAYKKYTVKTGIDLPAALQCGTAAAPTCGSTILGSVPAVGTLAGTIPFVQNANQTSIETQLKTYATNLQIKLQTDNVNNKTNLQVEDVIGGSQIDPTYSLQVGATLPYITPTSTVYSWSGDIPDQFRTTLRVQFDSINVLFFSDESYGSRIRLWGGHLGSDALANSNATTADRTFALYLEYRPLAKSRNMAGSANDPLTLTIDHPYAASGGTYADESLAQRTALQIHSCALSNNCGGNTEGTNSVFSSLTVMQGIGEASESEVSHFAALQRRDLLDIVPENPTDPKHVWMNNIDYNYRSPTCIPDTSTGAPARTRDNLCFGTTQATIGAAWLAQSSRARGIVGRINGSRLQHHHSLGYVLSGKSIAGTNLDFETSLSSNSTAAIAADRQSAFNGSVIALNRLEGGISEQQFDVYEGGSSVSFLTRSNNQGIRLLQVNAGNLTTVLENLSNYPEDKRATIQNAVLQEGYTLLLPQNGNLGEIGNATYYFNALAAYKGTDRIAYLLGDYLKGGGSTSSENPGQSVLESVKLKDYSSKNKKYYGVNLQNGDFKLTPPPDLVTGVGEFPYSLSFQRYYDSSVPLADTIGTLGAPTAQFERTDLGGGWKHNLSIAATIGSDGFAGLGRDSAVNAAGMIAGLYTLRNLNVSTTDIRTNLASILVTNWAVQTLNSNIVNVRRPPSNEVFVRLPNGSFNPRPGSAEQLSQTGARVPYNDNTWDYRSINFTLFGKDGSVLNLNKNYQPTQVTLKEREPSAWAFLNGVTVSFSYGDEGSLTVSNNLGRRLNFNNDVVPNYMKVSDENSRTVTLTVVPSISPIGCRPGLGCVPLNYSVTSPDGGITKYDYLFYPGAGVTPEPTRYRDSFKIAKWYTPTNATTPYLTIDYDSLFRVKSITDNSPTPRKTDYLSSGLYGSENQKRGESMSPLNAITTSYFDKSNNLFLSIDPLGRATYSVYDTHRRLTKTMYPEGNAVSYTYDARSNPLTLTRTAKPGSGQLPILTSTTYGTGPNVATCTVNARCNLPATTTDANGNVTTYTRAVTGFPTKIAGPLGTETSYCYNYINSSNNFTLVPYAKIEKVNSTPTYRVTSYTYNNSNHGVLATSTVDPSTTYVLPVLADGTCATQSKPGALNLVTNFAFDGVGNVATIDGPRTDLVDATSYVFDTMRRLTRITAPLNSITRYTYDLDGLLKTTQRAIVPTPTDSVTAHWQIETRNYFANGELQTVTDADTNITQYTYDLDGRIDTVTDPDGRKTKTDYDLAGQTLRTWKGWGSAQPGMPIRFAEYTYLNNGKQSSVKDANGNVTEYAYDGQDRLTFTLFPSPIDGTRCSVLPFAPLNPSCTGQQTFEGQYYTTDLSPGGPRCNGSDAPCFTFSRRGDLFAYAYDALNRLTVKTTSAGDPPVYSYVYNLLGEQTTVYSGNFGSPVHGVFYDYDAAGRKLYESTDGRQVSYQYNQAGNRSRTTWPDGYYVSYAYDALNRMTTVRENSTTTNELALYGYDLLSRRATLRLGGQTTNTVTYAYEADSDLDLLTHKLNATTMTLDYGRNRSHQITSLAANDDFYLGPSVGQGATTGYATNKLNQYTSTALQPMSYDGNGNLKSWKPPLLDRHTYSFDSQNRLITAAVDGTLTPSISYDYDPLGRRISKTVSGTQTLYLLDGDEEIAELNTAGTILKRYITGPAIDDRIATIDLTIPSMPTKTFYHVNHQGSVVAMTDAVGTVQQRLSYDEYGKLSQGSAISGQPYRYTGRRFDAETGLYYYRARYYSPDLGRFLSADPIGYKDDQNLYTYAKNDPVSFFDPNGKSAISVDFRDQAVHAWTNGPTVWQGHAGVVMINDRTGYTQYREFGRYNGTPGLVRGSPVGSIQNLKFDRNGVPTLASIKGLLNDIISIGEKAGSSNIGIKFTLGSDFAKMQKEVGEWKGASWSLLGRTCYSFCDAVVEAGSEEDAPTLETTLTIGTLNATAKSIQGMFPSNAAGEAIGVTDCHVVGAGDCRR